MEWMFSAFCYLCGFLALTALASIGVILALEAFYDVVGSFQSQGAIKARDDFAKQIVTDSWWFSESKEAAAAMKIYGQNQGKGNSDISIIREEWRRAIAGEKNNA